MDDNRNDAVILKSRDTEPRLPTYHFAHAVDDHLMRVNLVIRGEEWISSVPLHLQLFDALGFERVQYAHVAPLMKQDGGSRRKLSKRSDPEATVTSTSSRATRRPRCSTTCAAWPTAGSPRCRWPRRWPRRSGCPNAAPRARWSTLVKLDDISGDYIATLSGEQILAEVSTWARTLRPRAGRCPGRRATTWRCGRWPSSGRASPTRARTCASGRTSAPSTATSSRSSSSWSPTPADARFGRA